MGTIIFWGTGKIGKHMLDIWRQFGVQPDYFADNNVELWGTLYYGIRVLSIEELRKVEKVQILVTCNQTEKIFDQLLESGFYYNDIFKGNTPKDMFFFLSVYMNGKLKWNVIDEKGDNRSERNTVNSVLFDVQYGFVLGGVEAWAFQMAEALTKRDLEVKFITTDIKGWEDQGNDRRVIHLKYQESGSEYERLIKCLMRIRDNLPCSIICNFTDYTFYSACIAKALWPQKVNLIAVVHSDDERYYEQYGQSKKLIDYCVVTCDSMEERFLCDGLDKHKLVRMAWQIPCGKVLNRTYSQEGEPICIGYAGRIVKEKRMDLLIEIVKKLIFANIDFRLEIAGKGEYEKEMKVILQPVSDKVFFLGQISREGISDFWKRQDVGINCPDYEGRGISRAESMAAGAVPVITDTSSARDDVRNGYNGFVVSVGDVDGLVDKIEYLYHNREVLRLMGERSHNIILHQNENDDVGGMWDKLLKTGRGVFFEYVSENG